MSFKKNILSTRLHAENEVNILQKFKTEYPHNQFIPTISSIIQTQNNPIEWSINMELMHGDLFSLFFGEFPIQKPLELQITKSILFQIISGLNFIHNNDLVYSNLALQHCLFKKNENQFTIKLCDFSKCMPPNIEPFFLGTNSYTAPECLLHHARCFQSDIWSLGILFFHICLLKDPFPESVNTANLMMAELCKFDIQRYKNLFDDFDKQVFELINDLLQFNFRDRPFAAEILTDEWFER